MLTTMRVLASAAVFALIAVLYSFVKSAIFDDQVFVEWELVAVLTVVGGLRQILTETYRARRSNGDRP